MTTRTGRGLRAVLMTGAATVSFGAAQAQTTVDAERTTPLVTSADGDVTIASTGRVTVANGPAITLDSDASVTQGGAVTVTGDAANAVGVLIDGTITGTYQQGGTVSVLTSLGTDRGSVPASYATGRYGVLLSEGSTLTGSVSFADTAALALQGTSGAAVAILGTLDGDLALGGNLVTEGSPTATVADDGTLTFADGRGTATVLIEGTVTGDVTIAPTTAAASTRILARGANASGVVVDGTVGGTLTVSRAIDVTSLTDGTEFTDRDGTNNLADAGFTARQAQLAAASGSGLRVNGSVGGGVYLTAARAAVADDPATPDVDETVTARSGASLSVRGGGPALDIGDGAVIGALTDDPATTANEAGFAVVNAGGIQAAASVAGQATDVLYPGVGATAVRVGAADLAGGLLNATEATISSFAAGIGEDAIGVDIEAGASVPRFVNRGRVSATAASDTGSAVALRDASGSVASFANTGTLLARLTDFDDRNATTTNDANAPSGRAIAADFSANTTGMSFANSGTITGDVLFGSGPLSASLTGGTMSGNVSLAGGSYALGLTGGSTALVGGLDLGGGAGSVTVENGAVLNVLLSNAAGANVTLGGDGSSLGLAGASGVAPSSIASLTTLPGAQSGGILSFSVGAGGAEVSSLNVLGDAIIAEDTQFRIFLRSAIADDLSVPILTAGGTLDVDLSGDRTPTVAGVVPFLFTPSLSLGETGRSVVLTLDRKDADELGISPAFAPAYDPLIRALAAASVSETDGEGNVLRAADAGVGRAVFSIGDIEGDPELTGEVLFASAFQQFLPSPLDAGLVYARAQTNSVSSLVTQRVEGLRDGTTNGRRAWLQEESYFVNRGEDEGSLGFDGGGFVIAVGADTPLGGIDTVGVSFALASARYDEAEGEDFPSDRLAYELGLYAGERVGKLRLDGRVAYASVTTETERNVTLDGRDPETGIRTGEGDVRRSVTGEFEGTQLSAYARAAYEGKLGAWDAVPFASVDYLRLNDDAYEERNADQATRSPFALSVEDREATSLRGNLGLTVGRTFEQRVGAYETTLPGTITPTLTAAWSQELSSDDLTATYRFEGGDAFTLTEEKEAGAGILAADVRYRNEYAEMMAGVSGTFGENSQVYMLRLGVGLRW